MQERVKYILQIEVIRHKPIFKFHVKKPKSIKGGIYESKIKCSLFLSLFYLTDNFQKNYTNNVLSNDNLWIN